jgi:uncharacterized protein YggT (Ycf19 family)
MRRLLQDLTYFVVSIVEVLLAVRFLSKLLGASPRAPFIAWLYDTTEPLLAPFQYVFPTASVRGRFVLEFTTLFAIFVYSFIAYIVLELMSIFANIDREQTRNRK